MMINKFFFIILRLKNLLYHFSLFFINNFINIISIIFIVFIITFFIYNLKFSDFISIIISFFISFSISMFISNKFKLSNNFILRYLQKFVLFNSFILLIILFLYFFGFSLFSNFFIYCDGVDDDNNSLNKDNNIENKNSNDNNEKVLVHIGTGQNEVDKDYYSVKLDKKIVDNVLDKVSNVVMDGANYIAPNLGIGIVASKVATEVLRQTSHLPVAPRLATTSAAIALSMAAGKVGLEMGNALATNINMDDVVKGSVHADQNIDKIPSPTDDRLNIDWYSCPLEVNEQDIPLVTILEGLFKLNVIELLLLIILILLLANKYIYSFYIKIISNLINKKMTNNKGKDILQKGNLYNEKFIKFIIIFILISLLAIKLMNLFFSGVLADNIDSFVSVYNHYKQNSLLFVFSLRNIINKNINNCNNTPISCYNHKILSKTSSFINYNTSYILFTSIRSISSSSISNIINSSDNIRKGDITIIENDIKFNEYINLDIEAKINKFGTYENYLNQLDKIYDVNDYFMEKYYPNLINDEFFKMFLTELKPFLRTEVKFVLDLYQYIIKFNSFKDKIVILNEYLSKELILKLFTEFKEIRIEIIEKLSELGYDENDNFLDKFLYELNKERKNKLLLERSLLNSKEDELLQYEDDYINMLNFIINLLKKDLKVEENENFNVELKDRIILIENLIFDIYKLINFIYEKNLSKSKMIWFEKYKNEFIILSISDKTITYKIKKGENRKKRMSPGRILIGYKEILIRMKKELELVIINYLDQIYGDKIIKKELLDNVEFLPFNLEILKEIKIEDFNKLYQKVLNAFDISLFISNISKNLSDKNLNEQLDKFEQFFRKIMINSNDSHDNLINLYKLFNNINNINFNDSFISRENFLNNNSYLYLKCKEIINNQTINSEKRQFMLESFILNYEKEFTYHIIKTMNNNLSDFKLLTRIYKHSNSQFIDRINAFINNNRKRNYENYSKNKENFNKLSDHIVLVLFLTINSDQLMNIIFSKVIRLIGLSSGITQNELLVNLSDEMLITMKYNLKNSKIYNNLSPEEINIVNDIKEKLESLPFEVKYKFGDILLEFILDEFNYIFEKNSLFENNQHFIYISIKPQYLAILTSSIFNPIRLPMICKPKEWIYEIKQIYNESYVCINEIGGYLLDQFNEISKSDSIIRQHTSNKYDSIISHNQINSINFLNSKPFEINKQMLDFVIKEWNNKENNSLFKGYNKLHSNTFEFEKMKSSMKKEILSHNSKYWTYVNIINIAQLMKDQTIYFPSFLDFRGRIYPTPNYLSYQSNDLSRSLLLFKNVSSEISNNENQLHEILNIILKDDLYINIKNIKKDSLIKNIDYFKLYLANTYGKNKLSRKGRIKWVDNNINEIIESFENNFELFKENYLSLSKEPFQFLACIISYINYIRDNTEIKIPILFDASCSGIQHLSALTTDIKIAKLVNLLDNESPLDFYQYAIDQIIEIIKNLPEDSNKLFKNKILLIDINRKWLKNSIMTIPYNVTSYGISEKLEIKFDRIYLDNNQLAKLESGEIKLTEIIENLKNINPKKDKNKTNKGNIIFIPTKEILKDKNKTDLYFTQKDLLNLSNIIKSTVLNIIPPFNELKKYFDSIIDIMKILNLSINWVTPSGMTVTMSNCIMVSKPIKTSVFKKSKPISILLPTDQINYKNIKTGLMPNFIHSLDASNIHLLIKNIYKLDKENINLYTIHDCFASDYKNINIIELLVKHSFIELYFKQDYLKIVHESFILQIEGNTQIFEEIIKINDKIKINKYILNPNKNKIKNKTDKIYIPVLPDYKWDINKNKIYSELLFNSYFIS